MTHEAMIVILQTIKVLAPCKRRNLIRDKIYDIDSNDPQSTKPKTKYQQLVTWSDSISKKEIFRQSSSSGSSVSSSSASNTNNKNHRSSITPPKKFLYIGVITTAKYLSTRGLTLFNTWGKNLDQFGRLDFYIGDKNVAKIPYQVKKTLKDHIIRIKNVNDTVYPPQKKSLLMLKTMFKKYGHEFQWFMRCDDDTYIKTDKLENFLRGLNSTTLRLLGQTGFGNAEEKGKLGISNNENYCMGGPGVIMSKSVLEKVGPNTQFCLKELYSSHEDVEVSRCIKKYAGVNCAWSFETGRKFYNNYFGDKNFIDPWKEPGPYDLKLEYAITLHPNKNQEKMVKLHEYFQMDKIRKFRTQINQKKREAANVLELYDNLPLNYQRDYQAKSLNLIKNRPQSSMSNDNLIWRNFNSHSIYDYIGVKHGQPNHFKTVLKDINSQLVKHLNQNAEKKGRDVTYQQVEYGYFRLDLLHGVDYIIDIRLNYKRFLKRNMQVLVRKHAYLQQAFGDLIIDDVNSFNISSSHSNSKLPYISDTGIVRWAQAKFNKIKTVELKPSVNYPKINIVIPLSGKYSQTITFLENLGSNFIENGLSDGHDIVCWLIYEYSSF